MLSEAHAPPSHHPICSSSASAVSSIKVYTTLLEESQNAPLLHDAMVIDALVGVSLTRWQQRPSSHLSSWAVAASVALVANEAWLKR